MGDPPSWADVPEAARRGITLARVHEAMTARQQTGPVPEGIGVERVLGPTVLVNEAAPLPPSQRRINAAVLAVLFEEEGEARLILTRRSSALRSHRGEVSFPGGRLEAGESPLAAALREADEEIALRPSLVTPIGWIHPVLTVVTGSLIMPVVATVAARPRLVASPAEVERVFDVSLAELAAADTFHEERWAIEGHRVEGSDDGSFAVWFFEADGEMIWGATARMLHELVGLVLGAPGDDDVAAL
jgi:8-oxo-dGTP pyrophosphatase MutT (NUDIX family)